MIALVAGSTGLIGRHLIEQLILDARYKKIKCLTRRPLSLNDDKLEIIETEGGNLIEIADLLEADDVFCCLGTTIKKAKTKEAFKKIDFDYPLSLARVTLANGASQFHLISALGANSSSGVFYNRVKGEIEEAIAALGFKTFHVYRPSLLLGPRKEERSGEDAAKLFFKLFGFLIPKKFKAIDAAKVARAMVAMAKREAEGNFVHESKSMQQF